MMAEPTDAQEPSQEEPSASHSEAKPKSRRAWKWGLILFGVLVVLPFAVFTLWAGIALSWSYSNGDRAGYVQKFSRKGWVCKTWEGELSMVNVPGQAQERWNFSVRDDSIAALITKMMGDRVSLTYEEHHGLPTDCFGETNYFVVGVRKVP